MILYIDNTIEEEFSRRNFTNSELLFFLRLADFHRRGKCKLCGELHSLKRLCQIASKPLNGVFRTILNHYAEQGAALKSVDMVFVLTCSDFAEKESYLNASAKVLSAAISRLNMPWIGISAL